MPAVCRRVPERRRDPVEGPEAQAASSRQQLTHDDLFIERKLRRPADLVRLVPLARQQHDVSRCAMSSAR